MGSGIRGLSSGVLVWTSYAAGCDMRTGASRSVASGQGAGKGGSSRARHADAPGLPAAGLAGGYPHLDANSDCDPDIHANVNAHLNADANTNADQTRGVTMTAGWFPYSPKNRRLG